MRIFRNQIIFTLAILCVFCAYVTDCAKETESMGKILARKKVLAQVHLGEKVDISVKRFTTLRFRLLATGGFLWNLVEISPEPLMKCRNLLPRKIRNKKYFKSTEQQEEKRVFTFICKAVKEGDAKIQLSYWHPLLKIATRMVEVNVKVTARKMKKKQRYSRYSRRARYLD